MKLSSTFATSLLVISAFTFTVPVFAATSTKTMVATETAASPATAPAQQNVAAMPENVDYTLPYPGILIDSPLYFLKQWRDSVMEWLIVDPARKVEFYVLQSDKNLNAGVLLNGQGKQTLASQVITTSSSDMQKAVTLAGSLKDQGKSVPVFEVEQLTNSLAKHEEVLTDLLTHATGGEQSAVQTALNLMTKLAADVAALK